MRLLPVVAAVGPATLVLLSDTLPSEDLSGLAWPVRGLWRLWDFAFFLVMAGIFHAALAGMWQALRHRAVLRLDPAGVTDDRTGSVLASWSQVRNVAQGWATLDDGTVQNPARRWGRGHNERFSVLVLRIEGASTGPGAGVAGTATDRVVRLDIEDRSRPPEEIVEFARRLHARYRDSLPVGQPRPLPSRGLVKGLLIIALSVVLAMISLVVGVDIIEPSPQ